MVVKNVLLMESQTVTDIPVSIPFDFTNKDSLPTGKDPGNSIVIKPITVRTWFKLKPLIMQINKADIDILTASEGNTFDSLVTEMMGKYGDLLFDIICIGIHNKKGDMPEWFRNVLKDNCTFEDIYILLNAILFRIGCNPFMNSITALKVVSPLDEEEMIALQKNRESWKKKIKEKPHKAASCSS